MNRKQIKRVLYYYIFPYVGLALVKLLSATYRVKIVDPRNESEPLGKHKGVIYASWHQRFFPGMSFFSSRRPIAIIISKSRDGEVAARAVDILGWRPVRGSSSRGGREALEEIKGLGRSGYKVGHIVDGPQGPFGKVKPGVIRIAQHTGLPIVPTITSGQHCWVFNSWDRFMIPKPFSKVIIRFGRPIHVPPQLPDGAFSDFQQKVEKKLADLYKETDGVWESPEQIRRIYG